MTVDKQKFTSSLNRIFEANGLSRLLSREVSERLHTLTEFMLTENEKYNLTAITDPDKIILNHYADCAMLAVRLPKGASVCDIGCGAGFPTLPIAIFRPDVTVLGIDSTAKRINYVNSAAALLGITNVNCIAMRAEDGGKDAKYRERFDVVTARAVAELRILAELCLPYARVGGSFIAMKGKNAEFELTAAKKAIATLGGRNVRTEMINLVGDDTASHPLILIDKKEKTPAAYPRVYAQISKKPL